jgi:hypothetical protein
LAATAVAHVPAAPTWMALPNAVQTASAHDPTMTGQEGLVTVSSADKHQDEVFPAGPRKLGHPNDEAWAAVRWMDDWLPAELDPNDLLAGNQLAVS